jgi:hypothetical protein
MSNKDLVERLRQFEDMPQCVSDCELEDTAREAADRIEALEAELAAERKSLEFNKAVSSTRFADNISMEREILATHGQLVNLSSFLWSKFYQEASPDFKLFDRTDLAVTQIDNMIAGVIEMLEKELAAERAKGEVAQRTLNMLIAGFCVHSYGQINGDMEWPNNKEGDFLRCLYEYATTPPQTDDEQED